MNNNTPDKQKDFESIKHIDENGQEFWHARDLQPLLEYADWRNFELVINKAKTSMTASGQPVDNHFADVNKMVSIGYSQRKINDYKLTRYACYIIAQNGDPNKRAIAEAQSYFAQQTHKYELLESELQRIASREKLTETEKDFSKVMFERNVDGKGMAEIRSAGDEKLFGGRKTEDMKRSYGIDKKKPLADFLPDVTIKAKDLAAGITTVNTQKKNLTGKHPIKSEHEDNNEAIRGTLLERGIKPRRYASRRGC